MENARKGVGCSMCLGVDQSLCECKNAEADWVQCSTCDAWWPREELLVGMEDIPDVAEGARYCPSCGVEGLIEEE